MKKGKHLNPQEGNWGPRNLAPQLEGPIAALRQHPRGINPSTPINEASTGLNSRSAFYCLLHGGSAILDFAQNASAHRRRKNAQLPSAGLGRGLGRKLIVTKSEEMGQKAAYAFLLVGITW